MAHYKGAASEAGRAMHLMKKREKAQQEIELRKKKIEEDLKIEDIENKFATHYDAVEQQLKSSTIGLVTLDEMRAKQEHIVREREKKLAQKKAEKEKERQKEIEAKQEQKNKQKRQIQALSFDLNEEVDSGEDGGSSEDTSEKSWRDKEEPCFKKIRKNPDVDTSFLPDREREEADLKLREELRLEWVTTQAGLKDEPITVTFSYWDGSGHRKNVTLKKGNSIYQFLQRCLDTLRPEFSELKTVSADQLMYVKEDLILPHHYTFYDFIVTKARGKSGPLFQFDASDDVRLVNDATQEKQDSHAGKVLLRLANYKTKMETNHSQPCPISCCKYYACHTLNADCKRVFSQINNIKTEKRANMITKTISGNLLAEQCIKRHGKNCVDFNPTDKMINMMNVSMYKN